MKVEMRVAISGSRDGESWPAIGDEIEVSDSEGAELCAAGYAVPVAAPPARSKKAVQGKPETR